tara:strand:- start:207 stop:491 length:285 start_codon:yes stop_codon:yes gene_type:complete
MNKIGKYAFKDEETSDAKIKALGENSHAIVKLGHIILKKAENIDDYVFSDKYHLDVMWVGLENHPYGWKSAVVGNIDDNGVHSFYGVDYQTNKM